MYKLGEYIDPGDEVSTLYANGAISLYATGITNGQDFFIDYMEHDISSGGLLHTATYRLADCINEDFWCLGYSKLGTQSKLGY